MTAGEKEITFDSVIGEDVSSSSPQLRFFRVTVNP
jgi:hypothetical protein